MFSILLQGTWFPGEVVMSEAPSGRRHVDEVERAIEAAWQAAAKPGVQLFDGPMCRLESFDVAQAPAPRRLTLRYSHTSYRISVGTNLSRGAELTARYGPDVLANPLGASVALTTLDGYLLLGRRGGRVAYYPHRVHPFAGSVEPAEAREPFGIVYRELREELNLPADRVTDVRCLGLATDNAIRQPELIFAATAQLTRDALAATLDGAEHDALWSVRATDGDAVARAIADQLLTPIAMATLTMWRDAAHASAIASATPSQS